MATNELSSLFTPFTLNGITLRNRFVMPAMQRGRCSRGMPTPQMVDYYRRRVEGGIALVIGESAAVDHPSSTQQEGAAHVFGRALDGWADCIQAVKAAGGEMLLQLWHEGAVRKQHAGGLYPDYPSLSPSGLVQAGKSNGRAATLAELDEIREAFVRGALAARAIGAAGIEVHAAHGYFLDLFLWAETNRREDGYGGDEIRDRARFPAEIVAAIRAATGPDFIISFRFSQWKEVDFSARVVDTQEQLRTLLSILRTAGVDIFHASTRRLHEPAWPDSTLGLAGWTRALSDAPVIAVGSVGLDVDLMDNLFGQEANPTGRTGLLETAQRLERGEFDLVSVGRAVIGDADWVRKVEQGRWSELKPFRREDMLTEWEMDFVLEAHGQR
ncbi:MAG: 12-oxophytodienoate reductase [Spongiibacteraceae bacterium]|nr:12-oxophytodienoate reductase [Spongiibacteraceae bacterium]